MVNKRIGILIMIFMVIVLLAIGILIGISLTRGYAMNGPGGLGNASGYSAVYMTTGDIYFGKLSWFPSMHLTDVWYLEHNTGANGQSQLGVAPFTASFWSPINEINLNPQNVVFWTQLAPSQLTQAFNDPNSVPTPTANISSTPPNSSSTL